MSTDTAFWSALLDEYDATLLPAIEMFRRSPIHDLGMRKFLMRHPDSPIATLAQQIDAGIPVPSLRQPPASLAQIQAAEQRLNVTLEPSYKAFLQTSNGFLLPGMCTCALLPVELIRLFGEDNAETAEIWRWGFTDDDGSTAEEEFRLELETGIQISEIPMGEEGYEAIHMVLDPRAEHRGDDRPFHAHWLVLEDCDVSVDFAALMSKYLDLTKARVSRLDKAALQAD